MFDSNPVRSQIHADVKNIANGMTGNWLRRIAYAEIQRNHLRPRLEAEGLWMPVAAESWLASFLAGGEPLAPWLDEATLGLHAEQCMGGAWEDELTRRRNPTYRRIAKTRSAISRGLEAPLAALAAWLWKA